MIKRSPRRVDIVLYEGFQSLEAVAPLAVFDHTNALIDPADAPAYVVHFAAAKTGLVRSDSILSLEATKRLDPNDLPDVALVVGTRHIQVALQREADLVSWIRECGPHIPRLATMCSGCFFLAEAGLLDGKRATTHWNEARALQQRYPKVEIDPQPIFVREGNLFTSAGVTSGIDLALAIVEEDLGREAAVKVAKDLAVYLRRPGWMSQLSIHLSSQMSCDPELRELQEWILSALDQPLHLERLATEARVPAKELEVRFLEQTGVSHTEFIETARFELARSLAEDSKEAMPVVALRCGLHTVERMNDVFMRRIGMSAQEFRERSQRRRERTSP